MDTVLIAGGRTTGLMMAAELARRGIPVRIIDKSPGIDPHVRATLLHSRTLEIFQGLGIADQATQGSIAEQGVRIYANGELVGDSRHQPLDSPFPYGMAQSQAHVEAVLEAHLGRYGVAVERNVELVELSQDETGVEAGLSLADGSKETVSSQWLVGCDGAHSSVRHLIGSAFPGEADRIPYMLGDVQIDNDLERGEGHVFLHGSGQLFIFSTLPQERRLVCATLELDQPIDGAPSLEQLQAVVSQRCGPRMRLRDPRWLTYFHINYRLAPHYREGRVFLAGDAAHVHSLLAGQGMNTGIQDAFNLGWKLALVARRQAPDKLLDSYEVERRQVGEQVVAMTRQATENLEHYASLSEEERASLLAHMFVPESERLNAARHLQEVDLDYSASTLSQETAGEFTGGPRSGTQAPEAGPIIVRDRKTTLYRLPSTSGYSLYLFAGISSGQRTVADLQRIAQAAIASYGDVLDAYIICADGPGSADGLAPEISVIGDPEAAMHSKYGADSACVYLVRPDGYIAYRSKTLDSIEKYFKAVV